MLARHARGDVGAAQDAFKCDAMDHAATTLKYSGASFVSCVISETIMLRNICTYII